MSSHREAPEISKDPVADSTDLYAFVSPDRPGFVTIIANYLPLEDPDGGPNFFEFGDDVLYQLHISNGGDAKADVTYSFRFRTQVMNPESFLYNTGRITDIGNATFNRRQFYTVTRMTRSGRSTLLADNVPCPPCNIGPRSTPNYDHLAAQAVHALRNGGFVFAGQRADGFHVDLGAVFDLLDLRPFQNLHLIPTAATSGVNSLAGKNVQSIALQVPVNDVTRNGVNPTDSSAASSVIGVWTTASRQRSSIMESDGRTQRFGDFFQVSRLGNPLINEVIIPLGHKDEWNHVAPETDAQFLRYYEHPEVAKLLPMLYPGVFPNLSKYMKARGDIVAILLTGIPSGVVSGFQNSTGGVRADLLRLNVATPAAAPGKANPLGLVAGDAAGFPNGRRVIDDVVTIELRALAGQTLPLVDKSFTPDAAASAITDGSPMPAFRSAFPYLNTPHGGFEVGAA